jgi:cytochrome oxidase Cu insertion factor (SCO1/SenC/PrrC family)
MILNKKSTFYALILIFIIPMIVSSLLYRYNHHFHIKTINHGTLLNPAINVRNSFIGFANPGKWRIVYVNAHGCDDQCNKISSDLHQTLKALGKDMNRTTVMLVDGPNEQIQEILKQKNGKNFLASQKIYLVDPQGNLFMYYPETTDPMNILKDLKRVLEVSQIG